MVEKIAIKIGSFLNKYSPQKQENNVIINYGIEILLEFFIKIVVLISVGTICNKTIETVIFLLAFSILRSQAGGIHAKTGLGCLFAMVGVWGIGIFINEYLQLSRTQVLWLGIYCLFILSRIAPQFTDKGIQLLPKVIIKKKIFTVLLAICFMTTAYFYSKLRGILTVVVVVETITVILERRKIKNEKKLCRKYGKTSTKLDETDFNPKCGKEYTN